MAQRIRRPIDLPHPALADLGGDLIRTKSNAGGERHGPPELETGNRLNYRGIREREPAPAFKESP